MCNLCIWPCELYKHIMQNYLNLYLGQVELEWWACFYSQMSSIIYCFIIFANKIQSLVSLNQGLNPAVWSYKKISTPKVQNNFYSNNQHIVGDCTSVFTAVSSVGRAVSCPALTIVTRRPEAPYSPHPPSDVQYRPVTSNTTVHS